MVMKHKEVSLSFFIVGTIIGAGYASGREIVTFFTRYGYLSIALTILCGAIYYITSKLFLESSIIIKPKNFSDVGKFFFKKNAGIFNAILIVCFMVVVAGMLAGANSLGVILFENYSGHSLSIITALVCVVVSVGGIKAISKLNFIIVPIMIVFLLITSFLTFSNFKINTQITFDALSTHQYFMGIGSSILYVSLNMLLTGLIMLEIGKNYTKKEIKHASILFSVIITVITLIINFVLIMSNFVIFNSELPLVALSFNFSFGYGIIISIVVWLAILTSTVTTIYVIANYLKNYIKSYTLSLFVTVIVSFVISIFGFANIVQYLYPIMGIIGLVVTILLIKENHKFEFLTNNKIYNAKQQKTR